MLWIKLGQIEWRSLWTIWWRCCASSGSKRTASAAKAEIRAGEPCSAARRWDKRCRRRSRRWRRTGACIRCMGTSCARATSPVPIVYEVDRIRDGRSFTTRRVVANQGGPAIFAMSCSFQVDEPGFEHQAAMPPAPAPETLPTEQQRLAPFLTTAPDAIRAQLLAERPFEVRTADQTRRRSVRARARRAAAADVDAGGRRAP